MGGMVHMSGFPASPGSALQRPLWICELKQTHFTTQNAIKGVFNLTVKKLYIKIKIYYLYIMTICLCLSELGQGGRESQENLLQAGLRIYSHFDNGFLQKCLGLSPSICITGKIWWLHRQDPWKFEECLSTKKTTTDDQRENMTGKGDIGRHDHCQLSGVIVSFYFWTLFWSRMQTVIVDTIYIIMSLVVVSVVFNEETMMPQQEKRKRDTYWF